jgi:hypothetical protein
MFSRLSARHRITRTSSPARLVLLWLRRSLHEYWLSPSADHTLADLVSAEFDTRRRAIALEADENEPVPLDIGVCLAPSKALRGDTVLAGSREMTGLLSAEAPELSPMHSQRQSRHLRITNSATRSSRRPECVAAAGAKARLDYRRRTKGVLRPCRVRASRSRPSGPAHHERCRRAVP